MSTLNGFPPPLAPAKELSVHPWQAALDSRVVVFSPTGNNNFPHPDTFPRGDAFTGVFQVQDILRRDWGIFYKDSLTYRQSLAILRFCEIFN